MQETLTEGSLLDAFLLVMEKMHQPSEQIFKNLNDYFDPLKTSKSIVPFLAQWLNLGELLKYDSLVEDVSIQIDSQDFPLIPFDYRNTQISDNPPCLIHIKHLVEETLILKSEY